MQDSVTAAVGIKLEYHAVGVVRAALRCSVKRAITTSRYIECGISKRPGYTLLSIREVVNHRVAAAITVDSEDRSPAVSAAPRSATVNGIVVATDNQRTIRICPVCWIAREPVQDGQ